MHPASARLLEHFMFGHLHASIQQVSSACAALAREMATHLDSDNTTAVAEVTTGLRKLLEAKDCFVRAAVVLAQQKEAS